MVFLFVFSSEDADPVYEFIPARRVERPPKRAPTSPRASPLGMRWMKRCLNLLELTPAV